MLFKFFLVPAQEMKLVRVCKGIGHSARILEDAKKVKKELRAAVCFDQVLEDMAAETRRAS